MINFYYLLFFVNYYLLFIIFYLLFLFYFMINFYYFMIIENLNNEPWENQWKVEMRFGFVRILVERILL